MSADATPDQESRNQPADSNLDPIAQALEGLRKAGGKPGAALPKVASKRRMRDTRGRGSRVFKRPTGLDGRADRSYRDPKSMHDLIKPTIGRFGWAEDFAVGSVMNNWHEIVGPTVAERTRPVAFDKKKRELVIECDSTAWTTQLRLMKPQILKAIERLAGEQIVKDLKIEGPNLGPRRKGRYKVQGRGPRDDYG